MDRPQRVHFKIQNRNIPRLVMRRLRRAMHDQLELVRFEKLIDSPAIANIQLGVLESLRRSLQPLQVPQRIARRAKKHAPHVVVHADNFMPLSVEVAHRLRPDQSAAACHQNCHAGISAKSMPQIAAFNRATCRFDSCYPGKSDIASIDLSPRLVKLVLRLGISSSPSPKAPPLHFV